MGRSGIYSLDSLSGIYALVVDADEDRRALVGGVLRYCGARVTPVETPQAALGVMDLLKPDVPIVDDDREARGLLDAVLAYCGALTTQVTSARDARAALERVVPDVIVAAIGVADADGYGLVRELHAGQHAGARVPIVALTRGDDDPGRALAAGVNAHLHKPVDPWELCRIVASLVRKA